MLGDSSLYGGSYMDQEILYSRLLQKSLQIKVPSKKVNGTYGMGIAIIGLLLLGVLFSAAQISVPSIYTLF